MRGITLEIEGQDVVLEEIQEQVWMGQFQFNTIILDEDNQIMNIFTHLGTVLTRVTSVKL